jgi:hypothetical protein
MPVSPTDLVLVAVLNNKRDFEIARVLGWYRIPFKSAPKTVAVDWLAFYQTAKFGEEKWAINYIAPVRGHELTTRADLLRTQPDHPRAGEQYYKVQIGPLERLAQPILSRKWRRLTFLYSTGERLLAAAEINDLIIQSEERELLWKALRERGLAAERGELDFALWCALGNPGITPSETPPGKVKEWKQREHLTFPEAAVIGQLPAAVQRLGGPATQGQAHCGDLAALRTEDA